MQSVLVDLADGMDVGCDMTIAAGSSMEAGHWECSSEFTGTAMRACYTIVHSRPGIFIAVDSNVFIDEGEGEATIQGEPAKREDKIAGKIR